MSASPGGPLVSIVTPTLDRASMLRHTLASLRGQTYPHVEHIVVDGGSTDSTLELLREFEGSYPMRWISEPDDGMYQAINKGLGMARGSIVAYLNSDDLYFPWTVQSVVDAFDEHRDADFVHGDALVIDDDSGDVELMWRLPFDLDYIRRVGFLSQPAVFWRREAYLDMGPFDEGLKYVADCDYWMRAGKDHAFHKINEFLAVERDHLATAREAMGAQVWPELESVRSRYVRLDGPRHDRRVHWHARRYFFFRRLYSTVLLAQTLIPRGEVRGPWSRTVASGHLGIQRLRLMARLVPFLGPRMVDRFVRPDRYWLTPADRQPAADSRVVGS